MVVYGNGFNRFKENLFLTSLCAVLATCVVSSEPAVAQEVVAAWEGNSFSGNGVLGTAFQIPMSTTSAIMVRPTASYLYYDVRQLGVVSTHVTAPSVSLGLGYRYSDGRVTFDIGPSVQVLWERRKTVAGFSTEKTHVGAGIASAVSLQFTPLTSVSLLAGYDTANKYFASRAGIKQRVTDFQLQKPWWLLVGAEVIGQGNDEAHQISAGGLTELAFDQGRSALQLRAGYSWFNYPDHSKIERPYVGAGLYHRF